MRSVLLSPHNDDAELFAAFTCLRYRPHVVVCLRSHVQGNNWARRELETSRSMKVLGCTWEQWEIPDNAPDWPTVKDHIRALAADYDHVFAPQPRFTANGHDPAKLTPNGTGVLQHDRIGQMAHDLFGPNRFTGYLTYLRWGGKDTNGLLVDPEQGWARLKLLALAEHESQLDLATSRPHFLGGLDEYLATEMP